MSSQVDIEESFLSVLEEYTADEVRAIMSAGEKSKAQLLLHQRYPCAIRKAKR